MEKQIEYEKKNTKNTELKIYVEKSIHILQTEYQHSEKYNLKVFYVLPVQQSKL